MFARFDSNGNQTHWCRTVSWWKSMATIWENFTSSSIQREDEKEMSQGEIQLFRPIVFGKDAPSLSCTHASRKYKANRYKKKRIKKTYIFNAFSKVMSIWGQVSAQYSPPNSKMMRGGWCKSYNCCSVSLRELAQRRYKGGEEEEERQIDRLRDKQQKKCLVETIEEKIFTWIVL